MSFWPLLLCLISTWYFVGLIWTIQLVHYPLFAMVGLENFASFHSAHSQRIGFALALPFILGLLGAITLLWWHPSTVPLWSIILNLLFICAIWMMTAYIHVPLHRALGLGYSAETVRLLVVKNWLRTGLWTAQGLLLLWMTLVAIAAP